VHWDAVQPRLEAALGDKRLAAFGRHLVEVKAPDERLACSFLLKLAEQTPSLLREALADSDVAQDLVFCLGASELVATGLATMGQRWLEFFRRVRAQDLRRLLLGIDFNFDQIDDLGEFQKRLALSRQRIFLEIAVGDLLDRLDVTETMAAMSALADRCIEAALFGATRFAKERPAPDISLCVFALGKLGAGELNLSSDLDLAYLFDAVGNDPHTDKLIATKRAELTTELLRNAGFRIDLRLRPGGRFAPLVASFEEALAFYESFGQTWERAVLLRARPVAGPRAPSARFLAELERFIYRRYSDFETLGQLRAMKRQIEFEMREPVMVARNIKLGRGGIRELEFIVQALTLVYGGRDPRIRTPRTLEAIERLARAGYIDGERARKLSEAYVFLRDVEHKLQVAAGLQSHTLPADVSAMRVLSARLGLGKSPKAVERFNELLEKHRNEVSSIFAELLGADERPYAKAVSATARQAWAVALEPERSAPVLGALGFKNPEESANHLLLLARGPEYALSTPRRRALLESLGPRLLDEIRHEPDPDMALANLAQFIAAVGARTSFLSLLDTHEPTRRALLRLFSSSRYLSALFIRHPELLDTLVRSDLARVSRLPRELADELRDLLSACPDYESRLDMLRSFRHQEFLRIAMADLNAQIGFSEVQRELTVLAETILEFALEIAREQCAPKIPTAQRVAMAIVAMGRLGAAEMSYNSDLDLIFIYEPLAENPLASHEAAARVAQKVIAVLETKTREGYVYKVDLRLRPSGNAGPLVTALESWRDYYRTSAAVWERQSLVKARAVAGDLSLREKIELCRKEAAFARSLRCAEVKEIENMRVRIEHEVSPENDSQLNLKHGPGGLVDVEFLTQMLALRYGKTYPALQNERAASRLLAVLREAGLVDPHDCERLISHYEFLSLVEHLLRIESDQPAWAIPTDPAKLTPLARKLGFESADAGERLLNEIKERRREVRECFERYFQREEEREV